MKIQLSVNTSYVPSWGMWEGLREVLQNALDAQDEGYPLVLRYHAASQRLVVRNEGADLPRSTLLLGGGTKASGGARGKFGEGYKLALLVFARLGVDVTVHTPEETWTVALEASDTFGGADVLTLNTRARKGTDRKVEFVLKGVDEELWARVQERVLSLRPDVAQVSTGLGSVLLDPSLGGKLYVRGLYVGTLPDSYQWGYDLSDVALDRDRRMADPWSLRWNVARVLDLAVGSGLLRASEVTRGRGELMALSENVTYAHALAEASAREFRETHGEGTVAVDDMGAAAQAGQHGMKAVVVSREERVLLDSILGDLESRLSARALDVTRVYQPGELNEAEMANFAWGLAKVRLATELTESVQVVDFVSEAVCATTDGAVIKLARHRLADRAQLIATLVHEVAHRHGGDGSAAHREAIEDLFGAIVAAQ
jgi:hypothetical protein